MSMLPPAAVGGGRKADILKSKKLKAEIKTPNAEKLRR
jgi:hypothetical protein